MKRSAAYAASRAWQTARCGLRVAAIATIAIVAYSEELAIWRDNAPVERWFDVRRVHIADAVHGDCPVMMVDRAIHRRVRGTWIATLRKEAPGGGFVAYSSASGSVDYQPGAVYPVPLYLWWWMNWPKGDCSRLEPGVYILTTQWIMSPVGYPPKEEFEASNTFTILPRSP